MQPSGSFSLNYGNAELTFHYDIDPITPPEDWTYILHRDGRVDVKPGLTTVGLNRVMVRAVILEQIEYDDLNPPLVIYIKVK